MLAVALLILWALSVGAVVAFVARRACKDFGKPSWRVRVSPTLDE